MIVQLHSHAHSACKQRQLLRSLFTGAVCIRVSYNHFLMFQLLVEHILLRIFITPACIEAELVCYGFDYMASIFSFDESIYLIA